MEHLMCHSRPGAAKSDDLRIAFQVWRSLLFCTSFNAHFSHRLELDSHFHPKIGEGGAQSPRGQPAEEVAAWSECVWRSGTTSSGCNIVPYCSKAPLLHCARKAILECSGLWCGDRSSRLKNKCRTFMCFGAIATHALDTVWLHREVETDQCNCQLQNLCPDAQICHS